jgi:hypothetical protein
MLEKAIDTDMDLDKALTGLAKILSKKEKPC